MADRVADTPESRAFRKCTRWLHNSLNPDDVIASLYSDGVISAQDRDKINSKSTRFEKVDALANAVAANLAANPENFWTFVDALESELAHVKLASILKDECFKQGGHDPRRKATCEGRYQVPLASVPSHPSPSLPPPRPSDYPQPAPLPPTVHQDGSQNRIACDGDPDESQDVGQCEGGGGGKVYKVTTRKSHALAVILNNETFHNRKKFPGRPGSHNDVLRLREVLGQKLGFEVVEYSNLTQQQIEELFKKKIDGRIQGRHDSFFCCIMSHGGEDGLYGVDGEPVSTAKLMESLDGEQCTELRGKPKILIIHCCRGSGKPEPVAQLEGSGSEDEAPGTQDKALSPQIWFSPRSDFICGFSTFEGDIATLHDNGAAYIQTLCNVMEKNNCSLNEMLCTVNQELSTRVQQVVKKSKQKYKFVQTGQVAHTLREFVVFHQGP